MPRVSRRQKAEVRVQNSGVRHQNPGTLGPRTRELSSKQDVERFQDAEYVQQNDEQRVAGGGNEAQH
jgi:hypothetical protein